MINIKSRLAMLMATMLLGVITTANVYAIQPWSDGIEPLMVRMAEIDQALSLNAADSMSEFLTSKDVIRIAAEKESLLLEKANLVSLLKLSTDVRDSSLVIYALPSDARVNSTLHTGADAR